MHILCVFIFSLRYADKQECDKYNMLIKYKKIYNEVINCECECQHNVNDLEVPIKRHEDKKTIWILRDE